MTEARLDGWRVLIGRTTGRSTRLIGLLAAKGAAAQAIPLIDIRPPADTGELDAGLLGLAGGGFDWVAFTSVNAVAAALSRAAALGILDPIASDTRVAAVGPATAARLLDAGIGVDLVPPTAGSAATLGAVFPTARPGQSVLLPASDIAGDSLSKALAHRGFQVTSVNAYRTVGIPLPASVARDLADRRYEAVVVASPSGVPALATTVPASTVVVAIGAPTAQALAVAGIPTLTAVDPTDTGIVAALVAAAAGQRPDQREDNL